MGISCYKRPTISKLQGWSSAMEDCKRRRVLGTERDGSGSIGFHLIPQSATDSLQNGKPTDPCTLRGYAHDTGSEKLSSGYMAEQDRYLSCLHPGGNFTERRSSSLTLLQKGKAAGQQFCEEDWSNLKRKYYVLDDKDLRHYCFSSAYIVALLHDSLGIALEDERIGYATRCRISH